jgi:tRNA U55 pseudouridine synthase TruB
MITLDALVAHEAPLTLLSPVDALLSSFPAVQLNAELAKRFLNGQRLPLGKEPSIKCRRNRAGCASISTTNCWAPPSLANTAFWRPNV